MGCSCPRLGASLLGKQEPLGISDRLDLVQGMVTEVCAGLEEPKGETCYPKIWNEESCCCPRSGKANQGRESSPEPQAGSVSGGPVLLSSLWWGPEPAATRSSSICLALSQSGGGRGFALSSCLLMSHQGLSLTEPNSEPVGKGLGNAASWFPTLAAQKRVWLNDSGSDTCRPHLAQGLSGVWVE